MELLRRLAALGAVGTVVVILASTLTPLAIDENGCAFGVPCTLGHGIAFAALGLTLSGLYVTSSFARRNPRRALVMLILAIWIFAGATELAQAEVARDPSFEDWAADMLGAIGGLLVGGFLLRVLFGSKLPSAVPVEARASRRPARR